LLIFCYCEKIPEVINFKEKKLFWFMVSVPSQLVLCFWACDKAAHQVKEHVVQQNCYPQGSQEEEQEGSELRA
jgi:hypothetical protein